MKVLVIGGGQLAWDLMQTAPSTVHAEMVLREALDITAPDACERVIQDRQADVIINAAAYTAVDKAENEREAAFAVNEQGVANLAAACTAAGARLFHVSTDFVFDGEANRPYLPDDSPNPQSVYGASKLAGEAVLRHRMPEAVIVRTGWLYSSNGGNFVKTMLRLMAEKPELGVIVDQVGTPTWARGLAQLLWAGVTHSVPGGLYHWSDAGVASWYDFAVAIQDLGLELGLLEQAIPVRAIPASEFPTPAKRPAYSVLDKRSTEAAFGMETIHWRRQLKSMLEMLP
ncbi:dTDP-4-dehydrorhamnose reductase [Marinimicrobium locisalis]|uniref:dTDP-4-dehydrorhamnose reductase n=1 Tax=Marinimicrobium locisalis TaxID=546022 RepID=UPI003221987B